MIVFLFCRWLCLSLPLFFFPLMLCLSVALSLSISSRSSFGVPAKIFYDIFLWESEREGGIERDRGWCGKWRRALRDSVRRVMKGPQMEEGKAEAGRGARFTMGNGKWRGSNNVGDGKIKRGGKSASFSVSISHLSGRRQVWVHKGPQTANFSAVIL